jgi:hypothetical protein
MPSRGRQPISEVRRRNINGAVDEVRWRDANLVTTTPRHQLLVIMYLPAQRDKTKRKTIYKSLGGPCLALEHGCGVSENSPYSQILAQQFDISDA